MGEQINLFLKSFYKGQTNITVRDGKFEYINCEVMEVDNPLVLIKYKTGNITKTDWFHENVVTILNENKLI